MAFWKFGFHAQSAIDSILSTSTANQHHAHPGAGCSAPSLSNPSLLLDKLLEEDDLLQEIKAQHPKLVEFLGTRQVVGRILGYVSGVIFDDEDEDRLAENSDSTLSRLSSAHPAPSQLPEPAAPAEPHPAQPAAAVMGYGGALFNSFRTRVVSDTIGALLMDALDSEGRTPEDRAKAERRKIRYPYLCTEILASDLWSVTSQIFSDFPRLSLLTRFWDAVLDQPPSATASKSVQIGYWAKANITLINAKPSEMMSFIRSYPNLIPKLLAHFNSSPIVDVLMRIIQSEQTADGTIDWLIDSTDFIELIISLLHPSRTPDLHRSVADFLKDVIAFCTNQVVSSAPSPNQPNQKASSSTGSPPGSEAGGPNNPSASSPDLAARPVPGPSTQPPSEHSDDHPKFISTRLMRELSSSAVVAKLLSFGLDTPVSEDDDVITSASLASSLINSLSVVIDLIRRNNSDYSEHQLMVYLRDYPPAPRGEEEEAQGRPLSESAPRVVPLIGLLNAIGDRLGDLQKLIKAPRSATKPLPTVVGLSVPLTQERFRLIELYAELLHCSNMALVNRLDSEPRPMYNNDGELVGGFDALLAFFGPNATDDPLDDKSPDDDDDGGGDQHRSTGLNNDLRTQAGLDSPSDSADAPISITDSKEPPSEAKLPSSSSSPGKSSPGKLSPGQSSPEKPSPGGSSQAGSVPAAGAGPAVPAGVRMKELFLEHKVLDSCFELFFDFPWNNFLHNVIYDLVQQTLNAKFSCLTPSGSASLKLAQSFFTKTRIVDRLLDGIDANQLYQMKPKNGRLGHMGHLILIGDEVLKALENNPEEFEMIGRELETNERWKAFVRGPIDEAREHAKLPLGGVMPVMAGGLLEGTVAPATDEVESSLLSASTSSPPGSTGEGSSSILVDGSGKDSANGKGKKVAQGRTKKDGGKSSDEAEKSARVPANKAPPPSLSPQPKHADYDDDQWDSSRASDPSNFRSSILSDPTDAAGFPKMAPSIISNPTPFGFDDRFDASVRSFPQPFQEDFDLSEGDGQQPGGFDDDFGALQEAEMPAGGSTSAKRGTPRPGTAPYHPQGSAVRLPASSGEETGQEEEEWGEFAGPSPAITLTPSPNTSVPQNPALHDDDEDRWNDFDLLVDQSKSLALNHPSPTPPPPSSPGPP